MAIDYEPMMLEICMLLGCDSVFDVPGRIREQGKENKRLREFVVKVRDWCKWDLNYTPGTDSIRDRIRRCQNILEPKNDIPPTTAKNTQYDKYANCHDI